MSTAFHSFEAICTMFLNAKKESNILLEGGDAANKMQPVT